MKTQAQLSEAKRNPASAGWDQRGRRLEVRFDESGHFLLDITILPPLQPRHPRRIIPRHSWQLSCRSAKAVHAPDGADRFFPFPEDLQRPPIPPHP